MTVKNVFEVAFALIISLGGGGAIVWGLSSWLGKVWANRILEDEKAKHQKEIEGYKSELRKELERIGVIQDKALYISKAQYDYEYKIYQEIWKKLNRCIYATARLYPGYENFPTDSEERKKYQLDKYQDYAHKFNDFLAAIEEYSPFYKDDFYNLFIELKDMCNETGAIFHCEEFDKKYNVSYTMVKDEPMSSEDRRRTIELRKKIKDKNDQLSKEIREYLQSLRLRE